MEEQRQGTGVEPGQPIRTRLRRGRRNPLEEQLQRLPALPQCPPAAHRRSDQRTQRLALRARSRRAAALRPVPPRRRACRQAGTSGRRRQESPGAAPSSCIYALSPTIDESRTGSPQASTRDSAWRRRTAAAAGGSRRQNKRRAEDLGALPQTPALLGDEPGRANHGEWLGSCAVISSSATPRGTRPAAPGQAVMCGQGNQRARKLTGTYVHANDGLPWYVRPGMATPARRGDDPQLHSVERLLTVAITTGYNARFLAMSARHCIRNGSSTRLDVKSSSQ